MGLNLPSLPLSSPHFKGCNRPKPHCSRAGLQYQLLHRPKVSSLSSVGTFQVPREITTPPTSLQTPGLRLLLVPQVTLFPIPDPSAGRGKAVPSFRALAPKTTFISRLVASHTDPHQPLPGSSLKLKASQLPCRSIKPNLVPPRPTCPSSSLPSLPSTPGTPQSAKKRPAIQEIDIVNLVRTSGVAGLTKVINI